MKNSLLIFCIFLTSQICWAQEQCGSISPSPNPQSNIPIICDVSSNAELYLIPIIFHVVLPDNSVVTNEQLSAQIERINLDFRALEEHYQVHDYNSFRSDSRIEFYLAYNEENCDGITRHNYNFENDNIDSQTQEPCLGNAFHPDNFERIYNIQPPFSPSTILNIWVTDLCDELSGLGVFPWEANSSMDGILVDYENFGSGGSSTSLPRNQGKTLTHEIGHYLGLQHIFQGADPQLNICSDDQIDDTPPQHDKTLGCHTGNYDDNCTPLNPYTEDYSRMYMNYMDYTDDECRYLFTHCQAAEMRNTLETFRIDILNGSFNSCCPLTTLIPELTKELIVLSCNSIELNDIVKEESILAGSNVIWSTNSDFNQNQFHLTNTNISQGGTYYAFLSHPVIDCYSNGVSVEVTKDLFIDDQTNFNSPLGLMGNIIIEENGTLTISNQLSLSEESKVIVKSGGKLIISGTEAILQACSNQDYWRGITVENGGQLEIDNGDLKDSKNPIVAEDGSIISLNKATIFANQEHYFETGVTFNGTVDLQLFESVSIENYITGLRSTNSNSYYYLNDLTIKNCDHGINLNHSPVFVDNFDISCEQIAINVNYSHGVIIKNGNIVGNTGIRLFWSDVFNIANNTIGSLENPVHIGIDFLVCNNGTISDLNVIHARSQGIYGISSNTSISQNQIFINGTDGSNNGGISLVMGSNSLIHNNWVVGQNSTYGIQTTLISETEITHNNIELTYNGNKDRVSAIKSSGGVAETFINNTVSTNGNADGILVQNTVGDFFRCNEVIVASPTNDALGILLNSPGHDIKGNELQGGNDLMIRSVIGLQEHHGNEFKNGQTWAEDLTIAQLSIFEVNGTFPFHLPPSPAPASGWFINENKVSDYYDCYTIIDPTEVAFFSSESQQCGWHEQISNSYDSNNSEYQRHEQSLLRYNAIKNNQNLPNCISTISDDFSNITSVELALLRIINNPISFSIRDQLNNHVQAMIDQENPLIYINANEEEIISNFNYLNGLTSNNSNEFMMLSANLQSIETERSIPQLSKEILSASINFLSSPLNNDSIFDPLIDQSYFCSDIQGPYVNLARALSFKNSSIYFDQYDNCLENQIQERKTKISNERLTSLYPNPNNGKFTIQLVKNNIEDLRLFNSNGKLIWLKKSIKNSTFKVNKQIPSGIYFLEIIDSSGNKQIKKLVISEQ